MNAEIQSNGTDGTDRTDDAVGGNVVGGGGNWGLAHRWFRGGWTGRICMKDVTEAELLALLREMLAIEEGRVRNRSALCATAGELRGLRRAVRRHEQLFRIPEGRRDVVEMRRGFSAV